MVGDSRRVHWSLGPELFTRELREAFAFIDGAPAKLPDAPTRGVDIGFDVPADVPDATLALVGARIVTMKGDEIIDDGAIVVDKNRIAAVGPRAQVTIPRGARVIDAKGTTILPGLIDVHAHGAQAENGIVPQQSWLHVAELAFGVTTVHDPSNDTSEIFAAPAGTRRADRSAGCFDRSSSTARATGARVTFGRRRRTTSRAAASAPSA